MRLVATLLHRWVGLFIAAFLFVSGVTGAVISWDHELDELLNPHLTNARQSGPSIAPFELAAKVEAADPRAQVVYLPLEPEPGHAVALSVAPRIDSSTGKLHELGYNQVFLEPSTGQELGKREWGAAWPITSETFVSFLYKLHFSLHIPEFWGIDRWGEWLLGGVAILWTLDCFIGFYLTTPARPALGASRVSDAARTSRRRWWMRWKPAWKIRTGSGAYKINFDIHRALGLWTWALLFVLAFTAFSLNLYREIFHPLMSMVSQVTSDPFALRQPTDRHRPIEPVIGLREIVDKARAEGKSRGWQEPAGAAFYAPQWGIYGVQFFEPGDDHGAAGVGPAALYYDGMDGRLLGDRQPWTGTAADIFLQAQFPMHSGRILGLPGRILISAMGIAVAVLAVTGVVIWHRKRRARVAVRRYRYPRRTAAPAE